ncbi:hypothetical protein J2858_004394 [Neorhizobium galegae]|uniref:hypothetical protein n=1 Tax=Neorhizobium galegae TaxID=399 RepID=UPI001AE267E9|nr:hypothetical protein [Neorhizobium galegae]MBP2551452.1 hypothetical protein [Neorhizobium galegae]
MRVIVLFNLRPGVTVADYETWAKTTDLPVVNALPSIESFRVFQATGVMGSGEAPPYQYIEVVDIADEAQFGADVATDTMKRIAAEFQALADNPIFVTTTELKA